MSENKLRKITLHSGQYIQVGVTTDVELINKDIVTVEVIEIVEEGNDVYKIIGGIREKGVLISFPWKYVNNGVLTEYDVNCYIE